MKLLHLPHFLAVAIGSLAPALRADVSLSRIFGDSMVRRCDGPVPVWSRAAPGKEGSVRFAGQEKHAQANAAASDRVEARG